MVQVVAGQLEPDAVEAPRLEYEITAHQTAGEYLVAGAGAIPAVEVQASTFCQVQLASHYCYVWNIFTIFRWLSCRTWSWWSRPPPPPSTSPATTSWSGCGPISACTACSGVSSWGSFTHASRRRGNSSLDLYCTAKSSKFLACLTKQMDMVTGELIML